MTAHVHGATLRPLRPYQARAIAACRDALRAGRRAPLLVAPTGAGKCLGPETMVLHHDGSVTRADEVCTGDSLMGPDGAPRRVLGTCRDRGPMFRIVPTKGDPWTCNDVHVLTLVHTETGAIVDIPLDAYMRKSKWWRHCHKLWQPPLGVDFPPRRPPPIDPYFLGVWYGDGTKRLTGVEVSKPDAEIEAACFDVAAQWGMSVVVTDAPGKCRSYRITNGKGQRNPLLATLRPLVAHGVHPSIVVGSRETRRQWLAGMIDTDGHLSHGCIEIAQVDTRIADAVCFVARSLGLRVTRTPKVVGGATYQRMMLSGDLSVIPTRIARKTAAPRTQKKAATRTGFTVEPIGVGPYAGFELDGDGRFLLGDFTVTHNTRIGTEIVIGALARGGRVLWMAHRAELVDQAVASISGEGIPLDSITTLRAGRRGYVPHRPVCVASTQTLLGIVDSAESLRALAPTVIVLDEAHHYVADEWRRVVDAFAAAGVSVIVIGLTATPERGDGKPLGDMFDDLIVVATVAELTGPLGSGQPLVPCRILHPERSLKKASKGVRVRAADPLDAWREYVLPLDAADGRERTGVIFVQSVDESARVAAAFRDAGISAASIVGSTPKGERERAIAEFQRGAMRILVNMQVLTEGFDAPATEVVMLTMKCGSTGNYLQKIGRGLRASPSTGKAECLVVDLANASDKHGHPADVTADMFSLDGSCGIRAAPRVVPARQCRACGACFRASVSVCPGCGAEGAQAATVEVDATRLVAFPVTTKEERQVMYEAWQRTALAQGYRDGWVSHQFRRKFGVWPRGMTDVVSKDALDAGADRRMDRDQRERWVTPGGAADVARRREATEATSDAIDLGNGMAL